MAKVEINSDNGRATVSVDGKPLGHCVTEASVHMASDRFPEVTLRLAVVENSLDLSDACLKIGGIEAPEALERAMLDYLRFKYPQPHEEGGPVPADIRAAMDEAVRTVVRTNVVQPIVKMVESGLFASGGVLSGGPYIVGREAHELHYPPRAGTLPTAEEMAPAIRSVVQSVAADLVRLPVREMSGSGQPPAYVHVTMIDTNGGRTTETFPAPAGLTRTATDNERPNGRS
jgi:hypothetical protein